MTQFSEMDEKKWPEGFFDEVLGNWAGDLERGGQREYEEREEFTSASEYDGKRKGGGKPPPQKTGWLKS